MALNLTYVRDICQGRDSVTFKRF